MTVDDRLDFDNPQTRWSRSGSVVSDLILLVLTLVAVVGAAAGEIYVAAICGLVLMLTFVARMWTQLALVEVDYACSPSADRLMEGDLFELTLTIENRKPLPLPWLTLSETLPEGLALIQKARHSGLFFQETAIQETTSLGQYERVRFHHRVRAVRRGYYSLGPTRISSGDIFGFYEARLDTPRRPARLVVYPRTLRMPDFNLPPYRPIGDISSRARLVDDPTRPSGLREYRTGDAARHIDWKATARRDAVFVRTYDSSHSQRVVILLECDTSIERWRVYPMVLEAAVTAAASAARRSIELGYAVGLVCNGNSPSGPAPPMVAPGAGPDQLAALMTALAGAGVHTTGRLEQMLERYGAEAMPAGATVVYVAGVFRPSTVEYVRELGRRGHRIMALCAAGDDAPEIPGLPMADYRAVFAAPESGDA